MIYRALVVPLLFVALAGAGSNAPATGIIGADCEAIRLRLDGLPNGAYANFHYYGAGGYDQRVHWKPPLHQSLEFVGTVYVTEEQFLGHNSRTATVTFDEYNGKEAAGTYTATFPDGTTETGSFRVKHMKLDKIHICD